MKIILAKEVKKLGQTGQKMDVADGYARNYLIPQGWAYPATPANLKKLQEAERISKMHLEKAKIAALSLKGKLEAISCSILVEAGENDKLFGSVTSTDIVTAVEKEGLSVDKKDVILEEPIRQLGVSRVKIKLHPEVTAEVKVWVMKR